MFQHWCDDPDVVEGNICEFTSPFGGNADTIAESCKLITDADPHVETGVGEFPDTVNTVDTLGLSKHIFELDLKNKYQYIDTYLAGYLNVLHPSLSLLSNYFHATSRKAKR